MEKITIYHNFSCSKSCSALDFLNESQADIEIIDYLQQIPTAEELTEIVRLLGIRPWELVRKGEAEFALFTESEMSDEDWINAMIQYPILIERPIVTKGNKAIIGRPPSLVKELL